MYLTPTDKHWIIDIEADGLDPTQVWVMSADNAVTDEKVTCEDYESIRAFFDIHRDCYFVAHHSVYDIPVLNRLVGTRIPVSSVVDTFLLSSLYSPHLVGGHGLEAWGRRVGFNKPQHNEWDRYSEAMKIRNQADVEITKRTFNRLTKRMREIGFTERGAAIEHAAWFIIYKQRKNGFFFNEQQAHELYVELRAQEKALQERIYERFPPILQPVREYKRAFKGNGSPTSIYEKHLQTFPKVELMEDGGYRAFDWVEFKIGSPPDRVRKLLELGWKPVERTPPSKTHPEGQPKATDKGDLVPSLKAFAEESGIEEVKLIADWIAVNARANMVNNWLGLRNSETGCIHGQLWLAGTLRYRHDKPNTANIPRIRLGKDKKPALGREGLWTYEARDLWQTRDPKTRKLVGVDATGIQFRILAHYLNDEEFTAIVMGGDIHEYNRSKTGVGNRDQNKTFGYAALLGAGAAKTGEIFGVSATEGGRIKTKWIKTIPGLEALYARLEGELKRTGRITLCDGTKVLVPSPHMVLAYLLQGDESRIMKQAAIYVDEEVRREGLDVLKVGDIHDEWQNDVLSEQVERFIEICHSSFKRAGVSFSYNLPIECDSKVGLTWAETH